MQSRRKTIFTTIRTEGSILPADLLQRVEKGDSQLGGLSPDDYHLPGKEKLNEAISRSWNRLLGAWTHFRGALEKLPKNDPATTLTRDRWLLPLFQELGYGRLMIARAIELEGKSYPISHSWQHAPIHLVGAGVDLDTRTAGVAGAARVSPHSLIQEFLNRSGDHLWGFVSNGRRLRILRDNVSLTRQAFVECDLEAMMTGEVYSDFALLWLLCHQSRVEADKPTDCWLERWSRAAQDQGTRALDQLRTGVENAIKALGSGFLAHSANKSLLESLRSGELTAQNYYRQLLRLVYRLLFLFVAEDRDLLFLPHAEAEARERYTRFYSLSRLRRLAERRVGTRHTDLFQAWRLVMDKLGETGCTELGLPALGSFLFSKNAIANLEACEIANSDLLNGIRALAFMTDRHGRRLVDYKNLKSEELGSVYEALLQLHPILNSDAGMFDLETVSGNERKTTGSYYTPESLVQCLLDSALDPVLDDAVKQPEPETAILSLKVCDPACGSGHFLIAAAHRIAKRLASIRTGDAEPAPEALRNALRDVISHCVYGVDVNPMAVELCKVSLWMEALEPGKPLSFLEQRIQHGNSLLGVTPALLAQGIPDDAFKPIEGDNKEVCIRYKKLNKEERLGFRRLFKEDLAPWMRLGDLATEVAKLDSIPDADIGDIRKKEECYEQLVHSTSYDFSRLWADTWCAAFVWKKTREFDYPITEEEFRKIERNPPGVAPWLRNEIQRLAEQYHFFHWHLAFPDVFYVPKKGEAVENKVVGWNGGFDVVLGNPPWDKIQPEEQKFFARMRPDIARAKTATLRKRLIEELPTSDPACFQVWSNHKRAIEGLSNLIKGGNFFPLTAQGNLNTYRLFSELASLIVCPAGRAGLVVQSGLATDESGKELFSSLLACHRLARFLDFENRLRFFPDVDSRFRFALMTVAGAGAAQTDQFASAEFGWFLLSTEELKEPGRLVRASIGDLSLFNPTSLTSPSFRSERELAISRQMYAAGQHLYISANQRIGKIDFQGELFNMTRDERLFVPTESAKAKGYVSLYEAKCIHQFEHRFASQFGSEFAECEPEIKADPHFFMKPRSVVEESEVLRRATKQGIREGWMFGFRDISSPTNERTAIFCIFPFAAVGNSINLIVGVNAYEASDLIANGNSFAFDYVCRQKVGGTHVNIWIMKQLPAIALSAYGEVASFSKLKLVDWVSSRVLELTYTAWDLKSFAEDCGYQGPPFRWDQERRFLLRCELDAAYFHLYGVFRHDVDYIMETFPIVKRKDEQAHSEFRTKRVILEIYDEMQRAIETGVSYQTRLDPPAADPRVAHPLPIEMKPFLLPTRKRISLADDVGYAVLVVLSMLNEMGGTMDTNSLMNSYRLLTMPDLLETHGAVLVGKIAHEWRERYCDELRADLFLPVLRDLVRRGVISLSQKGGRSTTSWIDRSAFGQDSEVQLDVRLALRISAAMPQVTLNDLPKVASLTDLAQLYAAQ